LPVAKPVTIATVTTADRPQPRAADFTATEFWTAPPVPMALTVAMAGYDRHQAGAPAPIAPTAVVTTVSVKRSVGVDVITSAVIRGEAAAPPVQLLAYAAEPRPAPTLVPAKSGAAAPTLSMTALDPQSLRLWMGASPTQQRPYAAMTTPAVRATLLDTPAAAPAGRFAPIPR
jgi:hypothetical protein